MSDTVLFLRALGPWAIAKHGAAWEFPDEKEIHPVVVDGLKVLRRLPLNLSPGAAQGDACATGLCDTGVSADAACAAYRAARKSARGIEGFAWSPWTAGAPSTRTGSGHAERRVAGWPSPPASPQRSSVS